MSIITVKDAFRYDTEAQKGWYYQLPDVEGDVVVIPPQATYSYRAVKPTLKLLLVMDLLDLSKLPSQKGLKAPIVQ